MASIATASTGLKEGNNTGKKAYPPLVDDIIRYGTLAFDPSVTEETRRSNKLQFQELLER